ncbi:MAG TPA: hypothetical protein VFW63_03265 [Acidimicrobiales bacterium]|nr:hypothetical protein [Acidimicrobiales bacterium]
MEPAEHHRDPFEQQLDDVVLGVGGLRCRPAAVVLHHGDGRRVVACKDARNVLEEGLPIVADEPFAHPCRGRGRPLELVAVGKAGALAELAELLLGGGTCLGFEHDASHGDEVTDEAGRLGFCLESSTNTMYTATPGLFGAVRSSLGPPYVRPTGQATPVPPRPQ